MMEVVQGFSEDLIQSVPIDFDPNDATVGKTKLVSGQFVRPVNVGGRTIYQLIQTLVSGVPETFAANDDTKFVRKPYYPIWRGLEDSTNKLAVQQLSIFIGKSAIITIDNIDTTGGPASEAEPRLVLGTDGKLHVVTQAELIALTGTDATLKLAAADVLFGYVVGAASGIQSVSSKMVAVRLAG